MPYFFFFFNDDSCDDSNAEHEFNESIHSEKDIEYLNNPFSFRKVPGLDDIVQTLEEEPVQPKLKLFPKTVYSLGKIKRLRCFNWYNQFIWLEYSKSDDSVYCFPCRFFSLKFTDTTFISVGYKNWKNAMSLKGFIRHNNSDEHKQCLISWLDYKKNKKIILRFYSRYQINTPV